MADIKDTEIRFIGDDESYDSSRHACKSQPREPERKSKGSSSRYLTWAFLLCLLLAGAFAFGAIRSCSANDIETDGYTIEDSNADLENSLFEPEQVQGTFEQTSISPSREILNGLLEKDNENTQTSYCHIRESSINDIPFRLLLPVNAVPELYVGRLQEKDTSIVLALQAADIRKDNGKIVGACVNRGEIISKGLAKKGFVAIIEGKLTVGVSEHSSLFEEAIEKNGDFFRQYPVVAQGRIVENNPKNLSIRRAICERNGEYFVIETQIPVSFHDFSQMLVDLRVNNAVYLVGSQYACGLCRDENRHLSTWGEVQFSRAKNISYLVWRKSIE